MAAAGAAAAQPLPLEWALRGSLVAVAWVWHVQAVVQTEGRDQHAVWQDSIWRAGRELSVGVAMQACAAERGIEADDLQLSFPSPPARTNFHTSNEWAIEINLQI